jgi:cyclomaltodextrinase
MALTKVVMYVLFYMKRLEYILLIMVPSMGLALNPADVSHKSNSIFYVNPAAGQVKLRITRGAAAEAYCVFGETRHSMLISYRDETYDYFVCTVSAFDTTKRYHFIVKDNEDSIRYPQLNEIAPAVPLFTVPTWASGKIYYSVFVDGFFNGNAANDPDEHQMWTEKPKDWLPYGGDIVGIMQKIAYIESFGPDIILLQPIFTAASNHKYNTSAYTTVDPAFGDTTILKNLINALHAKNIKIVLSVIATQTGTDFPIFADIMNNSANSKYTDWYFVESFPLRTSPPNYRCWRSDYRFPLLNLQNQQVVNFHIGYIEFWKHFGFDGFYIGESDKMDQTFVQRLHSHLKEKYPDCLLLGSDARLINGQGFDGCSNQTLTNLVFAYFVKKSMTTSDFDQALNRLFFFNPPQANTTNLINLSTYDRRIYSSASADLINNVYAFLFTCPGSPSVLYGDEVGMSDCAPLNPGSFPWSGAEQNRPLFQEIHKLIEIRKTNPQIASHHFYTLYVNDITSVYAYDRGGLITILNCGDLQSFVELPAWDGTYIDLVSGNRLTAASQVLKLSIEPKSYRIFKREL